MKQKEEDKLKVVIYVAPPTSDDPCIEGHDLEDDKKGSFNFSTAEIRSSQVKTSSIDKLIR
jgi:hypothetical protein